MIRNDVAGIPLAALREPIHAALDAYTTATDGHVQFDLTKAVQLEWNDQLPNLAKSVTPVQYYGKAAGTLAIVAFEPGDGTGAESPVWKVDDFDTRQYPRKPKVIPRTRAVFGEVHLPIASFDLGAEEDQRPVMFAGNLALLGSEWKQRQTPQLVIVKLGELGQSVNDFQIAMDPADVPKKNSAAPVATFSVGYRGLFTAEGGNLEPFGEPGAVYNEHPNIVQVCGFLSVARSHSGGNNAGIFRALQAVEPKAAK